MCICLPRDLWLVRDADHLPGRSKIFHDHSYLPCRLSGNARVYLVKNKCRKIHGSCYKRLDTKHQATELTAAGHFTKRLELVALVGIKKKLDLIEAMKR